MKIFKKLVSIVNEKKETIEEDPRMILAALFIRVAKVDENYSLDEKNLIKNLLQRHFSLTSTESSDLLIKAELFEKNILDTVQLTRKIKDNIPYEQRNDLAVDLWRIVLVDNERAEEEDSFMRLCVKLIGVNDVDSALARKKAFLK